MCYINNKEISLYVKLLEFVKEVELVIIVGEFGDTESSKHSI